MDQLKQTLIERKLFNPEKQKVSPWIERKIDADLRQAVISATSFLSLDLGIADRTKILLTGVTEHPLCPVCKTPVPWHRTKNGFVEFCSIRCGGVGSQEKRLNTNEKRYGIRSNFPAISSEQRKKNSSKAAKQAQAIHGNPMNRAETKAKHKESVSRGPRPNMRAKNHFRWSKMSDERREFYSNPKSLFDKHIEKEIPLSILTNELGISYSQTIKKFEELGLQPKIFGSSYIQKCLAEYLKAHVDIIENDRKTIKPKEIDIFIPSRKVGIEVNGVYWHSRETDEVDYSHRDKFKLCEQNDIRLLQFTDKEIEQQIDIVMSMVLSRCGLAREKMYARNCEVVLVGKDRYRRFCLDNHIQGYSPANVVYGLHHDGELLSILSFGKPRYTKEFEWEIIRACSKTGMSIPGGLSKLWRHFLRNQEPNSVITYADNRYGIGNSYRVLGFEYSHQSPVNYKYCDGNNVYSRQKFQKHKLPTLLENYDPEKTEKQNMVEHGYRILYDCGNSVYHYRKG